MTKPTKQISNNDIIIWTTKTVERNEKLRQTTLNRTMTNQEPREIRKLAKEKQTEGEHKGHVELKETKSKKTVSRELLEKRCGKNSGMLVLTGLPCSFCT